MDPQALYAELGRLVVEMPDLSHQRLLSTEEMRWLGRVSTLVQQVGDHMDTAELTLAVQRVNSAARASVAQDIAVILYRALAKAELKAPITDRGAFIPAGNAFDAMAAVGRVLGAAERDVLIVDPYLDDKALTDFAALAPEGVTIRLLADGGYRKPSLMPAAQRWLQQYGAVRPLEVRLTAPRTLHDRRIIVDGGRVWVLTQSLNAFATRSPASIVRVDDATAELKLEAYATLWAAASTV